MLRRDSLRAQRDFFSPMTGNTGTEIRYAAAPTPVSGKYGSEVKSRLADIGSGSGRRAELIKAKKAAMNKTDDPFSQIKEIKKDGSKDNNELLGQLGEAAGAAQDAIGRGISQLSSAASDAVDQYRQDRQTTSDQIKGVSAAFDKRYSADKAERDAYRQSTSDQIKGISSTFDKQYGVLQSDIKSVKDQVSTVGTQVSTVGSQLDKVKADLNKPKPPQVTTKPENTPKKAVEVATKAKEEAAAEPVKKSRSAYMGNSKYKSPRRVANRNKAKAMAKARKANRGTPGTGGGGFGSKSTSSTRSGVGRGGRRGGSTGGRGASSKGGVSRGSRRSSPSRGGRRGGSTGGRGASSKGGTRRGAARRTNRSRSRRRGRGGRRCDIRCKVNISLLTNMHLLRDDLADVAYFVRELREAEL